MSRKSLLLGLSFAGISGLWVNAASAQFLAGNVWPNPNLSVPAAPGVDQVYSYYNGNYQYGTGPYTPSTTGDTNPRPDGWHRGGGDYGTTTTPSFCFYNSPANLYGEGTAPSPTPDGLGYALQVSDSSVNGYGEWFSDWNALPAGSSAGSQVELQFFVQWQGVEPRGDTFRVSAYFADSVGDDTLTAPVQIGNSTDYLIPGGTPDQTTWLQVDETLTVPAGAASLRITEDSGGTSAATGNIWLSDISLAAVPEPATLGVLATGGMLLLSRRRRT